MAETVVVGTDAVPEVVDEPVVPLVLILLPVVLDEGPGVVDPRDPDVEPLVVLDGPDMNAPVVPDVDEPVVPDVEPVVLMLIDGGVVVETLGVVEPVEEGIDVFPVVDEPVIVVVKPEVGLVEVVLVVTVELYRLVFPVVVDTVNKNICTLP